MHQGGCQCGSVRYEFNGEPLTCYVCHCTDCQSASGSAFNLSMLVQQQDLEVISGVMAVNIFTLNGNELHRHHCRYCGTALCFASPMMSEIVALKPGTFDDTSWFKSIAHLWVRSAQSWVTFDPTIPKYEKQPKMSELLELWQTRSGQ